MEDHDPDFRESLYMRGFDRPPCLGYQFDKDADEGILDIGKHTIGVFRFGNFSGDSSHAFIYDRFGKKEC
jgi:hypothetical protein